MVLPIGMRGAGMAAKAASKGGKARGLLARAKKALVGTPGRAATAGFFARDALDLAPGTEVQFAGHSIGGTDSDPDGDEPSGPSVPLEYIAAGIAVIAGAILALEA